MFKYKKFTQNLSDQQNRSYEINTTKFVQKCILYLYKYIHLYTHIHFKIRHNLVII